jgi:hypothetical protein
MPGRLPVTTIRPILLDLDVSARRAMFAVLLVGAALTIFVGLPALAYFIRRAIRRPLTPRQLVQEELYRERRRDALYFWR